MSGRAEHEIPAGLKQAQERFAKWGVHILDVGRFPSHCGHWRVNWPGSPEYFARLRYFGWTTPSCSTLRQRRRARCGVNGQCSDRPVARTCP
jgi:hypothetical protein